MIARNGRSRRPQYQALTVSARASRAPRRASSREFEFSGEELIMGSRLPLHCNRTRYVAPDTESISPCEIGDYVARGELGQEFVIALVHRRVGQQRSRLYAIWTRILRL